MLPNLLEAGHDVIGVVRDKRRFPMSEFIGENLSLIEADLLEDLAGKFPADIDVALTIAALFQFIDPAWADKDAFLKKLKMKNLNEIVLDFCPSY